MFRRAGRIGLILGLACTYLLQISAPIAQAADVTFTYNFATGSNSTTSAWQTFKNALTGSYGSFTFGGTNGSITVSDPTKVQTLANGIRTSTSTSVTINGATWNYYYVSTSQEEFGNQTSWTCSATSPMYVFRPTIGNQNWGGITASGAASSCSQTAQTMTITFSENAPTPTTFSTSLLSPSNISTSGNISYSLVLSQSVTDLATSDFQFGGSSTCNTPVGLTGSGTTYQVTVSNCSEGNLILQLKANSVTSNSITGPATVASANTIVIDRTSPTIASVTVPNGNYSAALSANINLTVGFSESVTVTGTPRIALTIGASTEYANFVSLTDSRTATFRFTVVVDYNDIDLDGIAVNSPLQLNSGNVTDLATNAIVALSFTPPVTTSVNVYQPPSAPTIDSITANNTSLTISFTAGASNGSVVSNYKYSLNGGSFVALSPTDAISPITITGLTNGTLYQVQIRAVSNLGDGQVSNQLSATPTASATVLISLTASATTASKGTAITITAQVNQAGVVTFYWNEKKIAGCIKKVAATSATCNWKPSVTGRWTINALLDPTDPTYVNSYSTKLSVFISRRTGSR